MTTPASFDELRGNLPSHAEEVMSSHGGQPSIAEQDRTHGAGIPAVDRGNDATSPPFGPMNPC